MRADQDGGGSVWVNQCSNMPVKQAPATSRCMVVLNLLPVSSVAMTAFFTLSIIIIEKKNSITISKWFPVCRYKRQFCTELGSMELVLCPRNQEGPHVGDCFCVLR